MRQFLLSLLGFPHLTFPFHRFTHLPSPSSSLTPPVAGGGIPAPVYPARRHAHTPNTLLLPMTPPPPSFSLSRTLFSTGERTVLRQRRTSDGGFDGGSVANTLQIDPSDLLPVPAFRLDQWGCILFYADGRGSQEPHSGGD
ncbi:hypothetical protein HanRHA438_Chr14g0647561 [Helianthus annuus]|uniref:Uncharacterized protein n=1 Tax=Helianthus annuus TaxID=4232 RepID=A0A9K3E9J8_HELAN|nr:hypothetical protein HanXRQr2_Chr14g0637001 [Helianthus annuus]KAJ0463722.1 hypothetical protein HanHA300_Chr14g0518891 [Helianthus annuus]KAJ0467942.1 hypothetical protein HanIR_Chr14g0690991 [Helianthus annuus]KAJ0485221.1 hypothetical protein HanHA89_Chr14g0565841 [Helianthus annuus]KAJ0655771.1 hypothetical protein HanLR1_Chr14g0528181 [Helianthus annuus]